MNCDLSPLSATNSAKQLERSKKMENAEQEFVSVVREYERVIYKVCYLYTTPNATLNDLYQEVVLNLWKAFIIRKTKRCGFPKRKVSKIRKFQKRNVFYLFKHTRGRETQKQPVSLPLVLYIQFKPNIIFTGNQTDSLINVILVNMNITEV